MLEEQGAEGGGKFGEEGGEVGRRGDGCQSEIVDASQELEDGQAGLMIVSAL